MNAAQELEVALSLFLAYILPKYVQTQQYDYAAASLRLLFSVVIRTVHSNYR